MGEFVCRVADSSGRVFSQVEPAQSVNEARHKLAERGLYVYSVKPRSSFLTRFQWQRPSSRVSGPDFLIFNQQFNTLIKAGLPILRALDLLAERAASPRLRPILGEVRTRVREGASLSEAIEQQGVFPKVYSTAVLAGEKSGNLPGVLDYYIAYQRVTTGVRKKILFTLIYPALLVTFASIIVSYLVAVVIPKFAQLYNELNVPLPGPTRLLVSITVGYRIYLLAGVGLFIAGVVGVLLWSRSEEGGETLDRWKLRLPVVGDTWIKFQMAQFSRTLSTLLAGGTPLVSALQTSSDALTSRLIRSTVTQAAQQVREGQSLHAGLAANSIIPELALDMIEVGESSGALAPMLNSVAEFYEEEVAMRLQALVSVIEPLILICMAAVVLFILIALYLPVFSLSAGGAGAG
ncbi:MAG TPA: type II secretion system F family protein [Candidatus Acidoferrales bacterium]|nr:type II secretion system F family protein [Candidatus Acidoferrales bacterium]